MVQLIELIGNKSITKLLDFFMSFPSQEFSQIKIKNKIKMAKATLTKWLKNLEEEELIKVRREGVSKFYKLNKSSIIVKQLKILNTLSKLKTIKKAISKDPIKLFLYGSAARGEGKKKATSTY